MSTFDVNAIEARDITDPKEGREFVKSFLNETTFYLATCGKDGQPANRPMSLITHFENKLVFATAKYKDVAHEISENPRISITAYIKSVAWVRLDAKATAIESEKLVQQFKDENPKHYEFYLSSNDEENAFYAFEDAKFTMHIKGKAYSAALA